MVNYWLQIIWKLETIQERKYEDKNNETKTSFTLWVAWLWEKFSISTNQDPKEILKLEEKKSYIFKVWTRAFEYTDKSTWEVKYATSYYIKDNQIEEVK